MAHAKLGLWAYRLRREQAARGWSVAQVAAAAGVKPGAAARVLAGDENVYIKDIVAVARALECHARFEFFAPMTHTTDVAQFLLDAAAVFRGRHHENITPQDLSWESFPQQWPSTALGYGGVDARAFTHGQTVLVWLTAVGEACVYFGYHDQPRLAYVVTGGEPWWEKAYRERRMPSVREAEEAKKPSLKALRRRKK